MENVGFAALQIVPSMRGFESKLTSGTSGPLSSAGAKGGRLFGNSAGRSMTSSIASHAKKAAFLGAAAFTAVGVAAFKLTKDSIAEARESQKVGAITTQVIKSTGGAAKVTAKQVGDLSTALSLKSGIDDEVIQSGANMMLTFKNVRNEVGKNNDIFNQSVAITEDMAAAMAGGKGGDVDLKSSSILVGKALNDPIKGLTALSRVGVTFTDQQKEQIKALVESGDTMKAQKIILGELKSEFGGTAAAQATMGEKVKTAWGNIEEQIGTALLPLLDKLERWFLKKGVPAIEGWVDTFQKKAVPAIKDFGHWITTKGVDKFQDFYDKAKPIVEKTLPAMEDAFDRLKPILKKSAEFAGDMAEQFTKMPKWAQTAIVGGLLVGKAGGFKITASLLTKGLASRAAPLPVIVMNPGFAGAGGAGAPSVVAGGGKVATLAKATLLVGSVYLAGKAFKDSGIPQKITDKVFHTNNEETFGKVLDGDQKAIQSVKSQMKAASAEWGTFSDNATFAFDMVDGAISKAMPLMKQYRHVIEGTPRDVRALAGITNYVEAMQQIKMLRRGLDGLAERGVDNGVPYLHGGTRSSGVNVNIGTVHVKDGRDLLNKSQQAALGGRRTY